MINTPVEHPVDVVRVDGKNRWVLFQIQRFRFFNLNVHRFCILGLMATGDVEEKGTGFDGHLMLDGQHGVFVSVPSVACSIKHMAQSVANPTCTEPGNSDGFVGVSGFSGNIPVHLERHQSLTLRHVEGRFVQQGKVVVSAGLGDGFQAGFGPREVFFGAFNVTLLKTNQASLHAQAPFEGQITGFRRPDHGESVFNRFTKMGVAQPSAPNQPQDGFFTRREVRRHGVQKFGCIHEQSSFRQRQPRRPVQFLFPHGQDITVHRTFGPPP